MKKLLSLLMCAIMILSVLGPGTAFAASGLSDGEIASINKGFMTSGTKLLDISKIPGTMSKSKITGEITSYKLTYRYTKKGTVNSKIKKYYEDMRNLNGIKSTNKISFALITKPTNLRQFPTSDWAHASNRSSTSDNFQECSLRIGEGIYIMHYSKDGKWAFVGTKYYRGWVKVSDFAIATKSQMLDYIDAEDFYMITKTANGTLNNKSTTLMMGTKLKKVGDGIVSYPARNTKGQMVLKSEKLSSKYQKHRGYLTFTRSALVKQMKNFEGAAYGWGMEGIRQDCTSSVMSAYMTFGILLPRDTSCWVNIKGSTNLKGKSNESKIKEINKLNPGDIIYFRGHGMMFTGTKNGKPVITHQTYPRAKTEVMPTSLIRSTDYIYRVVKDSHQKNTSKSPAAIKVLSEDKKAPQKVVAIDPGHQARGNSGKEPVGPGSKTMKNKVSSGTRGVATKIPESKLNLDVALKLRDELTRKGYKVYMVRTKQNVNISNVTRVKNAAKHHPDIYIRLHADAGARSVSGATGLCTGTNNKFVPSKISVKSKKLTSYTLNGMCKETKAKNRGISIRNDLSGNNWSKVPTALLEMGFMTNPAEDKKMAKTSYQKQIAKGIATGIDKYFKAS